MDNHLVGQATGTEPVTYRDRAVARRAKRTYDDVRLRALQADGSMALGAHIMEGLVGLDETRKGLTDGDPIMSVLLMEVEAETIRQVRSVQRRLGQGWNL